MGYGYDEMVGIDLGGDVAWKSLMIAYPALAAMDLARFTLDIEGDMEQIATVVNAVFVGKKAAAVRA
jgi:hypothetical protein